MTTKALKVVGTEDKAPAPDPLREAVEQAHEAAGRLQHWRTELDAAQRQVEELNDGAGAAVVSSPDKAQEVLAALGRARDRESIARAALPEAERQHREAVAAACRLEADLMEPERSKAARALDAHQKRTAELLEALQKYTGATYRRVTHDMILSEARDRGDFGVVHLEMSEEDHLQKALAAVQRRQRLLRGIADGVPLYEALDNPTWDDLGECLRTGGVADVGMLSPEAKAEREQAELRAELDEAEALYSAAADALEANPPVSEFIESAEQRELRYARVRLLTARERLGLSADLDEPARKGA